VSGQGFCPNSTVTIRLAALSGGTVVTVGTATADSTGRVSKEVTIPIDLTAGSYTIELVGTGSDCSAVRVLGARYTVTAKVLVKTGTNFVPFIAAAAGALLLGVVLVVVARTSKRRGGVAPQ
jgi:5-hydroxyisourate hydrolase-like protein (transthyretin family)